MKQMLQCNKKKQFKTWKTKWFAFKANIFYKVTLLVFLSLTTSLALEISWTKYLFSENFRFLFLSKLIFLIFKNKRMNLNNKTNYYSILNTKRKVKYKTKSVNCILVEHINWIIVSKHKIPNQILYIAK